MMAYARMMIYGRTWLNAAMPMTAPVTLAAAAYVRYLQAMVPVP